MKSVTISSIDFAPGCGRVEEKLFAGCWPAEKQGCEAP